MANTYLTRTVASSSNRKTWTWSGWVKRSNVTTGYQTLFSSYSDANNYTRILFWSSSSQQLTVSSKVAGSFPIDYRLSRVFRDTSAWYHIVVALDTTQATDTNRLKIYINGVLETAYEGSASSLPSQNEEPFINRNRVHYIGQTGDSSGYFDGLISHVHFCDGTALAPTVFGSTDSTTGEWKINTSPSFTPGTNGFTILKDGNTITDQSSNSNNWSLGGGTLTKTEDSPSNVFATMNPLETNRTPTLANGNLVIQNNNSAWKNGYSTIATPLTGKYYIECKMISNTGTWYTHFGIQEINDLANNASGYANYGDGANSWSYGNNGQKNNNGSASSYGDTIETGDIVGIAIDCTNSKLYFSNQGVWQNSGDPTSGATGTGAISITANKNYFLGGMIYSGYIGFNFGNGYFGTTAVSSAGTNASNNGIFEYNVPTGYTALSTKGLNL